VKTRERKTDSPEQSEQAEGFARVYGPARATSVKLSRFGRKAEDSMTPKKLSALVAAAIAFSATLAACGGAVSSGGLSVRATVAGLGFEGLEDCDAIEVREAPILTASSDPVPLSAAIDADEDELVIVSDPLVDLLRVRVTRPTVGEAVLLLSGASLKDAQREWTVTPDPTHETRIMLPELSEPTGLVWFEVEAFDEGRSLEGRRALHSSADLGLKARWSKQGFEVTVSDAQEEFIAGALVEILDATARRLATTKSTASAPTHLEPLAQPQPLGPLWALAVHHGRVALVSLVAESDS